MDESAAQGASTEPEFFFRTHGTCARVIKFDLDEDQNVHNVEFIGGCNGNARGIASLIEGMPASWVIERCEGTRCGGKRTSCPDQLSRALKGALEGR